MPSASTQTDFLVSPSLGMPAPRLLEQSLGIIDLSALPRHISTYYSVLHASMRHPVLW